MVRALKIFFGNNGITKGIVEITVTEMVILEVITT
mgnify:CR=1 FL=1